jgi:small-conductance mechanosensitive channel
MNKLSELFGEFLELINVKSIEAMGIKIFAATAIFLAAFWVSRMLKRFIDRRLRQDSHNEEATIRTYKSIARFIVMVPGILIAVHVLGINLSSLFTTSGLFAVALAFAMKNISENYISGMMLRLERTIKPGDVLESEGAIVRVKSIGFRATIARTKDERDLVIPNSQLVQNRVANYTYRDSVCRVETTIGVAYASDLKKVREVLESVFGQFDWTSSQHKPAVILSDFGASAVNFKIRVWIENPWDAGKRRALLNEAIWWGLKEAGIVMAYPQLDVHFDETFTKAAGLGRAHMEEEENE